VRPDIVVEETDAFEALDEDTPAAHALSRGRKEEAQAGNHSEH
jgi:hypothetical protein